MESRDLSMMYAQQAPAFQVRSEMASKKTDSTPTTPPSHSTPDLLGLMERKVHVIQNFPTNCCHCNAPYFKECFQELRDGSIMAYCKTPGACGRSLVLFAGVTLTEPVYKQICPFRGANLNVIIESTTEPTPVSQEQSHVLLQRIVSDPMAMYRDQNGEIDYYALHGIPIPDAVCSLCQKRHDQHETELLNRCDENGWVEMQQRPLKTPAGWPIYIPAKHEWSM